MEHCGTRYISRALSGRTPVNAPKITVGADSLNSNPDPSQPTSPGSTPPPMSANDQFAKGVAEKRAALDDHEAEKSLWKGGYSPKAMIGTWIGVAILSLALLVAAIGYAAPPIAIAIGSIVALWLIVAAIYAYRRLAYHYELTTQRFIHQSGVLSRQTDRIEVIDIDDVSFRQGPIQRMLGIGTIDITGSDRSHPQLLMRGIDDVKSVAGMIDDIRRKERKRRSLHIQSM